MFNFDLNIKNELKVIFINILSLHIFDQIASMFFSNRDIIFLIHRVEDINNDIHGITAEYIQSVLVYLRDNDNVDLVSVEEIINTDANSNRTRIAFTIDDGFLDQATTLAPLFIKNESPLTIFLTTGLIDNKLWPWDDQLSYIFSKTKLERLSILMREEIHDYDLSSLQKKRLTITTIRNICKRFSENDLNDTIDRLSILLEVRIPEVPPPGYEPLSWEHARELEKQGIRFCPHSVSNRIFSSLSYKTVKYEVSESKNRIYVELTHPLPYFAWPAGSVQDFTERDCQILADEEFKAAFSADPDKSNVIKNNQTGSNKYKINRQTLPDNLTDLIQYITWIEPFKNYIRSLKNNIFINNKLRLRQFYYNLIVHMGLFNNYTNIDWNKVGRLVFICKGNICRSPYAEFKAKKLGLCAISVGVYADGKSSAHDEAIKQSAYRNVDLIPHISNTFTTVELQDSDLVICMEPWQANNLIDKVSDFNCQITLLGLWGTHISAIVPDPYGKSEQVFQSCFDQIDTALNNINKMLKSS